MKIIVNQPKPRNPFVARAHFRLAGRHRPSARMERQQAVRSLKRDLEHMKQSP